MKNVLLAVILLLALPDSASGQVYVDLFLGAHPQVLNDGGASANIGFAIGRQVSTNAGYGVHVGAMSLLSVSTTSSFSTLGLQYRWIEGKRRHWFAKAELGSLLSASYTSDGPQTFEYQSAFNPYFRTYVGYRFGRFALGLNYTRITTFSERVSAYDDTSGLYLPTGNFRDRNVHDCQLYLGVMLGAFRPIKKRNNR